MAAPEETLSLNSMAPQQNGIRNCPTRELKHYECETLVMVRISRRLHGPLHRNRTKACSTCFVEMRFCTFQLIYHLILQIVSDIVQSPLPFRCLQEPCRPARKRESKRFCTNKWIKYRSTSLDNDCNIGQIAGNGKYCLWATVLGTKR